MKLQKILERMIDASTAKAAAAQITLEGGTTLEGAIRRDKDVDGVFVARVAGRHPKTGQVVGQAEVYFLGADVKMVVEPVEKPLVEAVASIEPARIRLD